LLTSLTPSLPISSNISLVAGSMSEGISYILVMMLLANSLSDRYRSHSHKRVVMIGAL
jgi:hypothetical protein